MRLFFLDASVLVKRYSRESGSAVVNELFQRVSTEEITCLTMGLLELVSVLVRKHNDGRLSEALFAQAMINVRAEIVESEAFSTLSITDAQILSALHLVRKHNLNATDAIILRSAMDISERCGEEDQLVLWTSDRRLTRAAEGEGITVFDPELETRETLHRILGMQHSS